MVRKWIELDKLQIYDEFHMQDGDSFTVNVELDGNTTEYHKEGVEYIKSVIEKGAKILPVLVVEKEDGIYTLLDGFKRSRAHLELQRSFIEAFVCTEEEYRQRREYPFQNHHIKCYKGGQPFEHFNLFEGEESEDSTYEEVKFLYKGDKINIEVRENIHIHWGEYGRYRLEVGRKDFLAFAEAIDKI